jgi:hypothetical protein
MLTDVLPIGHEKIAASVAFALRGALREAAMETLKALGHEPMSVDEPLSVTIWSHLKKE